MLPPIASQFIAAETNRGVLDYCEELQQKNIRPIVNYLGEHYTEKEPVNKTVDKYIDLISLIEENDIKVDLSLKPTQLGLLIDEGIFESNTRRILESTKNTSIDVWFDMENSSTTDATLSAYKKFASEYENIGICLQANLRRTEEDIFELDNEVSNPKIRIVKGAYNEDEEIAYTEKESIDEQYQNYLDLLIEETNAYTAVGTHDEEMVEYVINKSPNWNETEIQMLMGVRESRQRSLSKNGITVAQYVPYGKKWPSYTYRRIRENPKNILLIGRAVYEKFVSS